jgi:hypothetical protein
MLHALSISCSLITLFLLGEELWSSSLFNFLQPLPLNSSSVQRFPSAPCSQTYFSLYVKDEVSHPYRTTGRIVVLYIVIFTFWDADGKTKGSGLNGGKHYPNSVPS